MIDKINGLRAEIDGLTAKDMGEVEALRIKYLSKKGLVSALFADFRNVPAEDKKTVGAAINELKEFATAKINGMREALESSDGDDSGLDLTRTAPDVRLGTRHPLSLIHI